MDDHQYGDWELNRCENKLTTVVTFWVASLSMRGKKDHVNHVPCKLSAQHSVDDEYMLSEHSRCNLP